MAHLANDTNSEVSVMSDGFLYVFIKLDTGDVVDLEYVVDESGAMAASKDVPADVRNVLEQHGYKFGR